MVADGADGDEREEEEKEMMERGRERRREREREKAGGTEAPENSNKLSFAVQYSFRPHNNPARRCIADVRGKSLCKAENAEALTKLGGRKIRFQRANRETA